MPPQSSSSDTSLSSFNGRLIRRRSSSTNHMRTVNRLNLLVAGSVIVALFWTVSRVERGGEVVTASHLRGSGGSYITDAVFDSKASSLRIHPHTQSFVSYFKNLCILRLLFLHIMLCSRTHWLIFMTLE